MKRLLSRSGRHVRPAADDLPRPTRASEFGYQLKWSRTRPTLNPGSGGVTRDPCLQENPKGALRRALSNSLFRSDNSLIVERKFPVLSSREFGAEPIEFCWANYMSHSTGSLDFAKFPVDFPAKSGGR